MKITIICVGKLKEKYLLDAVNEYMKRLQVYIKVEVFQISDERLTDCLTSSEEEQIKNKEGKKILSKIDQRDFVVTLCIDGKQFSSEELSQFINLKMINAINNLVFVIGGSIGLGEEVMTRSNYKLSFSKMTFPHQLMRVILLEQIYRAFKIIKNEPYHK